jgi:hypothetical protein
MMLDTIDAALARVRVEIETEITVPPDASPLDFLCAVYRDPHQPMRRRMCAAEAALPFVHPKLSVNANVSTGFASRMERMMERRGLSAVIDARPAKAD